MESLEKLTAFFVGVIEPATAPDTMETPAASLQVLLTGSVAGTGGDGRMIGGAIALHGQDVLPLVSKYQIDSILACAVLRKHFDAFLPQVFGHLHLEI